MENQKIKQAKDINLRYLIDNFGLQLVQDDEFFREWQENLPEISDLDRQLLDKVKAGYINLQNYPPLLENVVRMAIVDPILFIGEFYLAPCYEVIIKGKIDTLILKDQFWAMIIESKKAEYSIERGLAQILTYMLGNPAPDKPSFGMITTGGSFVFVKLVKGEIPQYALSDVFEIRNRGNALYEVLKILKRLCQLVISS